MSRRDKRKKRKLKRILNIRNFAILLCIILIIFSLIVMFGDKINLNFDSIFEKEIETPSGIKVVNTKIKDNEKISEDKAKKAAVKQFKRLGEDLTIDNINVTKIQRKGVEYYYITSAENSLEIKIEGGDITRINSAPVTE